MNAIEAAIAAIVADIRQAEFAPGESERSFRELDIDSLEVANILLAVEEQYAIKIPDADVDALTSVAALARYVEARVA